MRNRLDLQDLVQRASDVLHAGRCFGPAYEKEGVMVIPVAFVIGGVGGGSGTQPSPATSPPPAPGAPPPEGSGGGLGMVSWPLGVYVVKDSDVRWVPAVDMTRVVLSGMALVRAFMRVRRVRAQRGAIRAIAHIDRSSPRALGPTIDS